jgi:hypothetical protein
MENATQRRWLLHVKGCPLHPDTYAPCIFYQGNTNDSILAGPDEKEIDQIIKEMKQAKLDITITGDLQDFLGVNIERKADRTIHLTQPHLINQILKDLRLDDNNVMEKTVPASSPNSYRVTLHQRILMIRLITNLSSGN